MRTSIRNWAFVVLALLAAPQAASAACYYGQCTAGSILFGTPVTRCCDKWVTTSTYNGGDFYSSASNCDFEGLPGSPMTKDGVCTICNAPGNSSTITGINSVSEVICGDDGNDIIDGKNGDNIIMGGDGDDQLTGGTGNDQINGDGGFDVIVSGSGDDKVSDFYENAYVEGGSGNDVIWTGSGDDQIYGGPGNDVIISGSGGDWVQGDDGTDVLASLVIGNTTATDDFLNGTFCGGDGNDNIQPRGAAHACVDGGNGSDLCEWAFWLPRTQTGFDMGTAINCETTSGMSTRTPLCGCP